MNMKQSQCYAGPWGHYAGNTNTGQSHNATLHFDFDLDCMVLARRAIAYAKIPVCGVLCTSNSTKTKGESKSKIKIQPGRLARARTRVPGHCKMQDGNQRARERNSNWLLAFACESGALDFLV